jgi:hypothetical protein
MVKGEPGTELDRERGHAPEKEARGPVCGSAAIAARDSATVVPLERFVVQRCPRDSTLREERELLRKSGPRLRPWHDHVEE